MTKCEIAIEILQNLKNYRLKFKNCREQGYDNGANMAGKYHDVQARLQEINEYTQFVQCAAHNLNLIGVHAASYSVKFNSFFGIVQNISTYFSGSTNHEKIFINCLKVTLKTYSYTRQVSKYNAIHSLCSQSGKVVKTLREISTDPNFGDRIASAESILKQLNLEFVYFLVMRDKILNEIFRVNKILQNSNNTIDQTSKMFNS